MKIYVIDFEISARWKRILTWVGAPLLALSVTAVASAAVRHQLRAQTPIVALELNENFEDLDVRVTAASERSHNGKRISLNGIQCGKSAVPTAGTIVDQNTATAGYEGAKLICQRALGCNSLTAHMCTSEEMVRSAQIGAVLPGFYYWVSGGQLVASPAESMPYQLTGDCHAWRSSGNEIGNVWYGAAPDVCGVGLSGPCPGYTTCSDTTPFVACCD